MNRYESLINQVKDLETPVIDNECEPIQVIETEKAQIYTWIRLYLKESGEAQLGDLIKIKYEPTQEELTATFIGWGKKGLEKDSDGIIESDLEDDHGTMIMMVNENDIKSPLESQSRPFIRSLFINSPFFEYQVYRREELTFSNERSQQSYDYIDVSF